ncbi:hypothetical protein [Streptomyces sp. NPDC047000]|uniref:hypothetical protein n=1 Tax=Streptomyces sp. NPDC047000 TaxID=3155474 RepID=UPI0033C9E39C
MRTTALLGAGILTAALLTGCNTGPACASTMLPAPTAQAAPLAPDKPRPPRTSLTKPKTRSAAKSRTKPKPRTKAGHTHHHDDHDCDD